MADINLNCPHCSQNLDIPRDYIGQTVECPVCGGRIHIDAPAPQAQPDVARIEVKPTHENAFEIEVQPDSQDIVPEEPVDEPKPSAAPVTGKKKFVVKKRGVGKTTAGKRKISTAGAKSRARTATEEKPEQPEVIDQEISPKSRFTSLLLCMFFGSVSAHRFYTGKIGTAILQIITGGGLGLWLFIDWITILVGASRDKQRRPVKNWKPHFIPIVIIPSIPIIAMIIALRFAYIGVAYPVAQHIPVYLSSADELFTSSVTIMQRTTFGGKKSAFYRLSVASKDYNDMFEIMPASAAGISQRIAAGGLQRTYEKALIYRSRVSITKAEQYIAPDEMKPEKIMIWSEDSTTVTFKIAGVERTHTLSAAKIASAGGTVVVEPEKIEALEVEE